MSELSSPGSCVFAVRDAEWSRDAPALRAIRYEVFVVEQHVPESLEWDGIDEDCVHAIALDEAGEPIGTGRLLPDGHIGRMAVQHAWRGRGVGAALLLHLVSRARARGDRVVRLNAQVHAIPFYERFGFLVEGAEFDEAGIPHCEMVRHLDR